jgi:hypothetical protein
LLKSARLFFFLVLLASSAVATFAQTIDPGVILRGDGSSEPVGLVFAGEFQTPTGAQFACPTDGTQDNCFSNASGFTFIALHLFFDPTTAPLSCGSNSLDPFFQNCVTDNVIIDGSPKTEITFSGLGSTEGCGGPCPGILDGQHFLLGLVDINGNPDTTDNAVYSAVADIPTPEPASALLFVIGIGAIALFLKRA